jgi:hypothetical protein
MLAFRSPEPRTVQSEAPSPLLVFLAGEFAERVAARWPAPHAVFLTAPAERRHLVCLALALSAEAAALDLESLLHAPLQRAIRCVYDPSPAGLARALARLGEIAWSAEDYRRLFELLGEHVSSKPLRHAKVITPEKVRGLHALPAPLRKSGLGRLKLTADQGALVAEACAALANHKDSQLWDTAPVRWADAATPAALFEYIRRDLDGDIPAPDIAGSERLVPLTTREAMRDAALRYRNCLSNYIRNAIRGQSVFFEWRDDPGAIVEIYRDPLFGWRFDEARLADNRTIVEPMRSELIAELRRIGVHVGRSDWELNEALEAAAKSKFRLKSIEDALDWRFGDDS